MMKTRIIGTVLLVVLVLVVGTIIGWFLSPAGQTWGSSWLRRPDGLTAIATVFAGVSTFGAVLVALFGIRYERKRAQEDRVEAQRRLEEERERFENAQAESRRQFLESQKQTQDALEEGRRQFLEAQYAANHPLLVPAAQLPPGASGPVIKIENAGTGIAINIWCVFMPFNLDAIFYPAATLVPMALSSGKSTTLYMDVSKAFSPEDTIGLSGCYTLGVPNDLYLNGASLSSVQRTVARFTLTYTDIFGRKHASIFDLTSSFTWKWVDFLSGIPADLGDIYLEKKSSASVPSIVGEGGIPDKGTGGRE